MSEQIAPSVDDLPILKPSYPISSALTRFDFGIRMANRNSTHSVKRAMKQPALTKQISAFPAMDEKTEGIKRSKVEGE